jgi:uncharacterized protein
MNSGWGGYRRGAGRPKNGKRQKPRLATDRGRVLPDFHYMQALLERSSAKVARTPERSPFKLPIFPDRAMPAKHLQMGQDSALMGNLGWAGSDWLAGGQFTANIGEGLLFPGYPFLAELAQRPEYRLLSEIMAREATKKWIEFKATGDENREREDDEDEENDSDREKENGSQVDKAHDRRLGYDLLPSEEQASQRQPRDPIEKGNKQVTRSKEFDQQKTPKEQEKKRGDSEKLEKIKELEDFLEFIKLRDRSADLCLIDGEFGRGHLYLDNGQVPDDELLTSIGDGRDTITLGKVGRGWLKGLKVIEPVWTYPQVYNANNPLLPGWYDPQQWYVMGQQIHASRLLKLVSRPVPDMLKPAYAFGGISMSQLAQPYVDIWLKTSRSIGQLVHAFSVMCLATDLSTIGMPAGGGQDLLNRVSMFNLFRDNMGAFVYNKESEDFKNVSVPLGGLHELQAQAMEHMAFPGQYPLVKFTGIAPTGLNASSEGEIRMWYDTVKSYQGKFMRPALQIVIDLAMLTLWGARDEDITWDFVELHEMTEKEKGEMQKAQGETYQIYTDMGAVSPAEVRAIVVNDKELPFTGLDPEDVPELKEEEMEGLVPPGAGKGLEAILGGGGEESKPKKPGGGEAAARTR